MYLKIGILYEGKYDKQPISALVEKIIGTLKNENRLEFLFYPASGPIIGKMKAATTNFFDRKNPCNISIFLADIDKSPEKVKLIMKFINDYKSKNPVEIILGTPNPTFEQWFIKEESAIKKHFKLPNDKALPYPEAKPKDRFKKIFQEHNDDVTVSISEVYGIIAQNIDILNLSKKDKDFKRLNDDLLAVAKSLKQAKKTLK